MNTEQQARQLMAKHRRHEEHLHENMVSRSTEELESQNIAEIEEKSRELTADHRQHEKHIEDNILNRANEEIH